MAHPGVIVLHDLVLHHLIVEMTLARGDVDGYVEALRANHGEAGAAWARGRAAGLHSELGNFLFPASVEVAKRSRAVIVHNRYAKERLESFGVETPIFVAPHPYEPFTLAARRQSNERVIGLFGFLTSAKRSEVILEAFRRAGQPKLRLLVVGEPAPDIDVERFRSEGITFTGYVDDLAPYYARADRLVNLRYPTAGETSGTLIRALAAGKPVAVSDYAQFAELPDDCVVKIPLGAGEVDALVHFFTADLPDPSAAQRKWLEENATVEKTVAVYREALWSAGIPAGKRRVSAGIPLFPQLELLSLDGRKATVRNIGLDTLRTRMYGEPAYRLIVKSGNESRWIELPLDLRAGETTIIDIPASLPPGNVTFHHALESIPMLEPEAWARATIR
jgi:glycosyltransferase involved in cell wall biosynthesis